jgi:hypothetical protein
MASTDKVLICWVRSTTLVIGDAGESGELIPASGLRLGIDNRGPRIDGLLVGIVSSGKAGLACDAEAEKTSAGGDADNSALSR